MITVIHYFRIENVVQRYTVAAMKCLTMYPLCITVKAHADVTYSGANAASSSVVKVNYTDHQFGGKF